MIRRAIGYLILATLMCVPLWLTGCSYDPAKFIAAAGTRSACLHVTGMWGTVDAWTMNQNNSTIKEPCEGNQGMNIAPTPPTIVLVKPNGPTEVIRP
jgi:hypothetical protein